MLASADLLLCYQTAASRVSPPARRGGDLVVAPPTLTPSPAGPRRFNRCSRLPESRDVVMQRLFCQGACLARCSVSLVRSLLSFHQYLLPSPTQVVKSERSEDRLSRQKWLWIMNCYRDHTR